MVTRNIFLVGMPGSGKSTLGKLLAQTLGLDFIDSDAELVTRNGVEISTIFELEGEAGFRARESALLAELAGRENLVLATGGGAVVSEANRRILREHGLIVYLRADIEMLLARTSKLNRHGKLARPLLAAGDREQTLRNLLAQRAPLYIELANIIFDATGAEKRVAVSELAQQVQERWSALTHAR
jgi:shikimate kinase